MSRGLLVQQHLDDQGRRSGRVHRLPNVVLAASGLGHLVPAHSEHGQGEVDLMTAICLVDSGVRIQFNQIY